ncbi:MAG: O-antigen ligase family protein, partial [Acidimicrobiales bacterium]
MSITEIPPDAPSSDEPPGSDGGAHTPTAKKQPRWWRAWWWSVALFGTALTSWVFTSGGMKGILTLAAICALIVGGVVFWKFLHTWFFSRPPDEVGPRPHRYLEDVVGSAVRRPTLPFQMATIVVISLVAALASFGINGIEDVKWWFVGILAVVAVFTLVAVRNRALFALFVVIGSIAIPLVKSWGPLYMFQWNWNILAPGLYTSTVDLAVLILYVVWFRSGTMGADMKRAFGHWATWLPFMGLLSMVPSVVAAGNHYTAITQFHRFIWPVLIYLYLVGRVRHRSHLWVILGAFMVIIVVQLPVVLMQYKTGGVGPLDFLEVSATDKEPGQASLPGQMGRPMGTFIHPAVLGSVVGSFALMLCAIGASMKANQPLRYVFFASAPLACVPIVLSHTRSPFLAILVMGLVLIGIVVARGWMSWRTVAVWLLVLLTGLGVFHEKVESTIGSQITGERVYLELQARVRLSSIARRMTMDSPVYGVGLNNFQQENRDEEYRRENLLFVHNVHNFYMLMLSETGFLGLISTYLIGLSLFVLSYRLSRSKDWLFRGIGLGAVVYFGFLAMEAGFSFLLRMDQLNAFFWVVAGMVVACLHMDGNLRPKDAVFGGPHEPGDNEPEEIGGSGDRSEETVTLGPTTLVPIDVPRRFVPLGRRLDPTTPKAPVPALMQSLRAQQRQGRHSRPVATRDRRQQRRLGVGSASAGAADLFGGLAARIRSFARPATGPIAVLSGAAGDGGGRIRGHGAVPGGFGRRFLRPSAVLAIVLVLGASQAVTAAPDLHTDGL